MTAMQRNKGQRGERELFALLSRELGAIVKRNVDQARSGGADGLDIPGWAVEVKRQETLAVPAWWAQCQAQADALGRRPILFFRRSRRAWTACLDLHDISPVMFPARGSVCSMGLEEACQILRETMTQEANPC